jgi:hypothetical protein
MPVLEAIAIDPGPHIVHLGLLTVAERRQLKAELDAAGWIPAGAPLAGSGGASAGDGAGAAWVAAGVLFLVLSGLAGVALWRRRTPS